MTIDGKISKGRMRISVYIVISLELHDTDMEFVEEIFRFKQKLDALAEKEKI